MINNCYIKKIKKKLQRVVERKFFKKLLRYNIFKFIPFDINRYNVCRIKL